MVQFNNIPQPQWPAMIRFNGINHNFTMDNREQNQQMNLFSKTEWPELP